MNHFADGDRVTVTRTLPSGAMHSWTGRLDGLSAGGFYLVGHDVNAYFASAGQMLKRHGVVQDVQPAPDMGTTAGRLQANRWRLLRMGRGVHDLFLPGDSP